MCVGWVGWGWGVGGSVSMWGGVGEGGFWRELLIMTVVRVWKASFSEASILGWRASGRLTCLTPSSLQRRDTCRRVLKNSQEAEDGEDGGGGEGGCRLSKRDNWGVLCGWVSYTENCIKAVRDANHLAVSSAVEDEITTRTFVIYEFMLFIQE